MKAPSFQWYPKDCDTDENVRAMDDTEFGFYMRCLNHSWLNHGLPENLEELGRILGRNKHHVCRVWPRVSRCFVISDGRYVNLKQESQRKEHQSFVDSRKKAANVRWGNVQPDLDARALQVQCPASASASASASALPNTQETTCVRAALPTLRKPNADDLNGQTSQKFEQWFSIWAGVRGNAYRPHAFQAYVSTVLLALESDAMACAQSYIAGPGADPAHGYRPDNFIFEMARDSFKTRWPTQQKPPERRESAMESAMRKAKEAKNGTR
jgi:uncharacterized protein YdaU (DUF1376 family)